MFICLDENIFQNIKKFCLFIYLFIIYLFIFRAMPLACEVSVVGVKLELQLLAYTMATANTTSVTNTTAWDGNAGPLTH